MLAVKDEFAGKRGACPKCKASLQVPATADTAAAQASASTTASPPTAAAAPLLPRAASKRRAAGGAVAAAPNVAAPPVTAPIALMRNKAAFGRKLLGGFRHDIARVKVSLLYRLGIVFAALVMILLPLAYLGVIGLAASAVYYHCAHHAALLEMGTGRARLLAALLYVAPVAAGGILVLFLLKPLFAGSASGGRTRSLTRQGEPLLFAFVDRLCQAVGARTRRESRSTSSSTPRQGSSRPWANGWSCGSAHRWSRASTRDNWPACWHTNSATLRRAPACG